MEVLLSALPPQMQVQAAPVSTSATATRPELPVQIASLPKGTLLEGFVVNRDAQGNPILRTAKGDILVKSELFLKTGSEVLIRLSGTSLQSGQSSARIVSVDQQPIAQLLQQQQAALKAPHGAATRETVSTQNAPLQALLIKPAAYGSESQSQQTIASILRLPANLLPSIRQGMALQFQVATPTALSPAQSGAAAATAATQTAATPPAASAPPSGASVSPAAAAAAQYGAYQKTAAGQLPSQPSAQASGALPAPPPSVAPPPAPSAASAPATLTATVIGHEGNETVVRTSIGTLKLLTPAPLPTGSQIPLIFVPSQTTGSAESSIFTTTTSTSPAATVLASALPHDWEALREAMQLLAGSGQSPAAARDIAARIPNTKSELVNSVLFFLSAMRGGELQRWLGQANAQKIDAKSPNLLKKLAGDFAALSSLAASGDKPDMPWQMLAFPLLHEDSLNQARLFWRHEQATQDTAKDEETRFIFDLELSELGALQIDGLVQGQRPHCRCDLLIRSDKPLTEADQHELMALYASASEAAGIAGQLRFTSGKESLLHPLHEMRAAASGGDDGSIMA